MGIRVAVAGASGYAGGELLRLLAGHPDLEIAAVSAGSSAGKPITSIHPNLTGHPRYDGTSFDVTDAATLKDAELIFMALPHGESAALASELPDAKIIDLSADFRLGDEEAWHQFYGQDVRVGGGEDGVVQARMAGQLRMHRGHRGTGAAVRGQRAYLQARMAGQQAEQFAARVAAGTRDRRSRTHMSLTLWKSIHHNA